MTLRNRRRVTSLALLTCFAAATSCSAEAPDKLGSSASALSSNVVIAELYANNGTIGATGIYKNGYVVLFNRGSAPVSLSGMLLQFASATANFQQFYAVPLPNSSIQPGKYFLVEMSVQGIATGGPLPSPDVPGGELGVPLPGKVALVTGTPLSGCGTTATPCPTTNLVDLVGWGATAQQYEGAGPAPAGNETTSVHRKGGGCIETDDNAADFEVGAPTPKNSATPAAPCGGTDAGTGGTGGTGGTVDSGTGGTAGSSGGTAGSAGAATGGSAGAAAGGSAGAAAGGSAGAAAGGSAGAAAGGSAGAATGGSGGTSSGGSGGTGATTGSGGSPASGGAGSGGKKGGDSSDDGGCGCEMPGNAQNPSGLALLALLGLLTARRRHQRNAR